MLSLVVLKKLMWHTWKLVSAEASRLKLEKASLPPQARAHFLPPMLLDPSVV